jgi:streptogramin lyase
MAKAPGGRGRLAVIAAITALSGVVGGPLAVAPSPVAADVATIREFQIPTPNTDLFGPFPDSTGIQSGDIARGPDGNVWFTEELSQKVGRITPAGVITEFAVPGQILAGIAAGPDGRIWVVDSTGIIFKMSTAGVIVGTFAVAHPTGCEDDQQLTQIVAGPNQTLWFTDLACSVVYRITTTGSITAFPVRPQNFTRPNAITVGPDGNLWFTESGSDADGRISIGRLTPGGVLTEFKAPVVDIVPTSITAGSDGNLWFTDVSGVTGHGNQIWRVTPAGVFTPFPISAAGATSVTTGPDGKLWYTAYLGDQIGRLDPATGEVLSEIRVPTPEAGPVSIVTGSDGKLWFYEARADQIGSIDPATIAPNPPPCLVITRNTTLTHDIGPCQGSGIVVAADNVTLDLAGHKVQGANLHRDIAGGIRLPGRHGVVVKGPGTVTGFDSGIVIQGGGGNTIRNVTARDNIGPLDIFANLGDGIILFNTSDNRITGNRVIHNGVYDGIGILGQGSNHNHVQDNLVRDTVDPAPHFSGGSGVGVGVIVNGFLDPNDPRRGESLEGNDVIGNTIEGSASNGLSLLSNRNARIADNVIRKNGFEPDGSPGRFFPGNGIGVQHLAMAVADTRDLIENNLVWGNVGNGIEIGAIGDFPTDNTIRNNVSTGNALDPTTRPAARDLKDHNLDCDHDIWRGNVWGSGGFDPPCTTIGGHPAKGTPPASAATVVPTPPTAAGTPPGRSQPCGRCEPTGRPSG